jgi:hypothetical protein
MLMRYVRRILPASLLLVCCTRQVDVHVRGADGNAHFAATGKHDRAIVQPYVLLVTGPKTCLDVNGDIRAVVDADARYATEGLGMTMNASAEEAIRSFGRDSRAIGGMYLPSPTAHEFKTALDTLATNGMLKAGLVLLYSGHGVKATPKEKPELGNRSYLCLDDGEFDVGNVVRWIETYSIDAVPWLGMVLNACESSYVDVSSALRPVGVLAASSNPMIVHAFPGRTGHAGSCQPKLPLEPQNVEATPFVRATTDALRLPQDPKHDRNGDGIVTLHELFHALSDAADSSWRDCDVGRPEPKLQLQARSEIPIRFHDKAVDTRRQIEDIVSKLEGTPSSPIRNDLLRALHGQLELATKHRLPETQWDFVISDEIEVGMRIPNFEQQEVSPPTSCWGHPVHLAWAPSFLETEEQLALARFAIFSSFYEIKAHGPSLDLILPYEVKLSRTKMTLQTVTVASALAAIPPRIHSLSSNSFRALSQVPEPKDCLGTTLHKILSQKHFEVCVEEEGQCFTTKATH